MICNKGEKSFVTQAKGRKQINLKEKKYVYRKNVSRIGFYCGNAHDFHCVVRV
jgi:hypothetical protein